jgi:hypothetical protein
MSNIRISRNRSRVTPSSFSTTGTIGKFYVESSPGSDNWVLFQTRVASGVPYAKAENCLDENHGRPPYYIGGPFRKIAITYPQARQGRAFGEGIFFTKTSSGFFNIPGYGAGRVKYVGGFAYPTVTPGSTEDVINLGSAFGYNSPLVPNLTTLANSVWDRTKPKIEQGGLAVALREAQEVPRMMMTSAMGFAKAWQVTKNSVKYRYFFKNHAGELASMAPKDAANHFLNHNFGWVPFIKDLVAFIDNSIYLDVKIRKICEQNGRWIKRRVHLVNSSEEKLLYKESVVLVEPANIEFMYQMYSGSPQYEIVEKKDSYAIGEGRFRYYVDYFDTSQPSAQSVLGAIRQQLALHGARISPSNVYKSTPWTWLIDWHTGAGTAIQAIQDQALDGMAAQYLYLIHHQIKTSTIRQVLPFTTENGGPKTLEFTRLIDVKQRKEADTPFGFGLSADLSNRQLALLAALGITRK